MHGSETETVVKNALLRVKVEQQEALEEQKRRAREARLAAREAAGDEDEEPEEEEQEEQTHTEGGESMDGGGHGQSDMSIIADFHCFDVPQFTSKVL